MAKSWRPRGSGLMHRTTDWMSTRGVNNWPAFLALAGGLLKEALVGGGLHVHAEGGPLGFVDAVDECLETDRLGEARLRAGEDAAERGRLSAERGAGGG